MKNDDNNKKPSFGYPIGICIGLAVGAVIGAITHDFELWLPLGFFFGMCIGLSLSRRNKGGGDKDE